MLTQAALARLKKQASEDYLRPWRPGQQLTDAELIWKYIVGLQDQLNMARDKISLHGWEDRMGGAFSREEIERCRNGGW